MCGIAGIVQIKGQPVRAMRRKVDAMSALIAHRGPDDAGVWVGNGDHVALAHRRLSIIDPTPAGHQPMGAPNGTTVTYNGEIYNHIELRAELNAGWSFASQTDTEVLLAAYARHGTAAVDSLRGMFAFALWDERRQRLFCARDRFGIKPLYFAQVGDELYFASEIKALLPLLPEVETNYRGLAEYLTFQFTVGEETMFRRVRQLAPGHCLIVEDGQVRTERYWDVEYSIDQDHSPQYFHRRLKELLAESVHLHLRSDVPVGSYLSGGIDSSLVSILASEEEAGGSLAFHGKFTDYPGYDESRYAAAAARQAGLDLHEARITAEDFRDNLHNVIYHLDQPVGGPGSFPQYMVSRLASRHVKVVLGGQGGDEVFGGYARYLIAYFEQCIKAAIDGTYRDGNFVVTPESILPNLTLLQEYKPLIKQFFKEGLFDSLDRRYLRLVDRSSDMGDLICWEVLDRQSVVEKFMGIFNSRRNVAKEAYLDSMTHFDFKTLLPALLQVEDRMSMAHGLESRVPILDHPLIEFAARIPADVKMKDGRLKHMLKDAYRDVLPREIVERRDKMGFPVPLREWASGPLKDFVQDIFHSRAFLERPYLNGKAALNAVEGEAPFSRRTWGLMCLEVWQQTFHDQAASYRDMVQDKVLADAPIGLAASAQSSS